MTIFAPQISSILPSGTSYNDKNQSKYVIPSSNQTYLPINTHFGGHRGVSGELLSDFGSTGPKMNNSWSQSSPILPTGASYNNKNHSKYVISSSNQTYLPISNHFGGHRRVFGKLLSDFCSNSPKFDNFWPQISPILPTGASYNDKTMSKYVSTSSNQTYLSITTHFGGHGRVIGELLSDFWSTSPKIGNFQRKNSTFLLHKSTEIKQKYPTCCFSWRQQVCGTICIVIDGVKVNLVISQPKRT